MCVLLGTDECSYPDCHALNTGYCPISVIEEKNNKEKKEEED